MAATKVHELPDISYLYTGELPLTSLLYPKAVSGGYKNLTTLKTPIEFDILISWGPKFIPPYAPTLIDGIKAMLYVNDKMDYRDPMLYLSDRITSHYTIISNAIKRSVNIRTYVVRMFLLRRFLLQHPGVCLIQSDKGKNTALIYTRDYRSKMDGWISKCIDIGTYHEYTRDFNIRRQSIYNAYKTLAQKLIDYNGRKQFMSSPPIPVKFIRLLRERNKITVRLPYMYGTMKIHKEGQPCRPICSTRSWFTYPVQKIVAYVLRDVLDKYLSKNNVRNVNNVVNDLNNMLICSEYQYVKYDIIDMYTTMNKHDISKCLIDMTRTDWFQELCCIPTILLTLSIFFSLHIANYFTYNGKIYSQVEGLPQGACDSGLLATIMLDYLLQLHTIQLFNDLQIVQYWKYMDDFLLYMPRCNVGTFKYMFETVTKLQLTVEREEINEFPILGLMPTITFLDIRIIRGAQRNYIRMYHKPNKSKRMIHYYSNERYSHKQQTMVQFLHCVLYRTSNIFLIDDLLYYENLFLENSYPLMCVSNIFVDEITKHLVSKDSMTHLKENLIERKMILKQYIMRYSGYVESVQTHTVSQFGNQQTQENLRPQPIINRTYSKPIVYCCEDITSLLVRIFRDQNLGYPTFTKANSLFIKLHMSLADPDPTLPNKRLRVSSPKQTVNQEITNKVDQETADIVFVKSSTTIPQSVSLISSSSGTDSSDPLSLSQRISNIQSSTSTGISSCDDNDNIGSSGTTSVDKYNDDDDDEELTNDLAEYGITRSDLTKITQIISNTSEEPSDILDPQLLVSNRIRDSVKMSRKSKIYMLTCTECENSFIVSGLGAIPDLNNIIQQDTTSVVYQHKKDTGHTISDTMTPLPAIGKMPINTQLMLYRSLYASLGVQCEDSRVLEYIPHFVQRGTDFCIRQLRRENMLTYTALGLPETGGTSSDEELLDFDYDDCVSRVDYTR